MTMTMILVLLALYPACVLAMIAMDFIGHKRYMDSRDDVRYAKAIASERDD